LRSQSTPDLYPSSDPNITTGDIFEKGLNRHEKIRLANV
jgi:hypothetical protein